VNILIGLDVVISRQLFANKWSRVQEAGCRHTTLQTTVGTGIALPSNLVYIFWFYSAILPPWRLRSTTAAKFALQ